MKKVSCKVSVSEIISRATQELTRQGYSPVSISAYKCTWRLLAKYATEQGISDFSEQLGANFLKTVFGYPSDVKNTKPMVHAARTVRILDEMQHGGSFVRNAHMPKPETENVYTGVLRQFKSQAAEKLSHKSVCRIELVIVKFFAYLIAEGVNDCADIVPRHIDGFAVTLSGQAKKTLSVSMYGLRVFFEFLFTEGLTENDLRKSVPAIKHVKRRNVPATWSEEETDRILNAIDRANPVGKRDYAVLLAIARLGLRQSDIVDLRFKNIDWAKCTLTITQCKTKRLLALPLPEDVGDAIIDYLKNGRPPSDEPYVFIKHVYPFNQMNTVYALLDKYLRTAGIKRKPYQARGPHTLRHSLAGKLLENRTPIEIIAAVLGHASINTTLDYLQIDFRSLAECAIDPEGVLANG